jgi:hypothetical protein
MPNPFSPTVAGHGSELTNEEYEAVVRTPLEAASAVLSLPGVTTYRTAVPWHVPIMGEPVVDETVWAAPNDPVAEFEPSTGELVLMDRAVRGLKIMVRLSNETLRSNIDSLAGAQATIVNMGVKILDKALLMGDATAGIDGLLPAAGTTTAHSRTVSDGVLNSTTTVVSATAAFGAGDVGRGISGAGIPANATIVSVTNATTVIISAAATATGPGVSVTVTSTTALYDELVNALATAESAYAEPTSILMHPTTLGTIRKLKTTQGLPLLSPNMAERGGSVILNLEVVSAPQMPVGTLLLVDPRTIAAASDVNAYARVLTETYAANDQTGILIVSRYDIGCTIPAGLVAVTGVN